MPDQVPEGVFAFIVVDLNQDGNVAEAIGCEEQCSPVLGVTKFNRRSGYPPTFEKGLYRASSGNWTMEIAVYEHILDAWEGDLRGLLLDSIEPLEFGGDLPAFNLNPPLRWATDTEIPNQMEVTYPMFVVRRDCGALSVNCSPGGSVQVIPADEVFAPAPSWDHSRSVVVLDVP